MNKTVYSTIKETLYEHKLSNGLTVFMLPKAGYHKTYVTLSTPMGSNVTTYLKNGEIKQIPFGVAHFLEHKLFEQDGKDVSELFAQNGAQVNAYTMNNRTTYLFSCTDHILDNIEILMQFVFHPTFTTKGIEAEIGIIAQEISMYEDDPNTAIYMGLLKNMYHNHPVQHDILGTVETISTITKELLDDVHQAYYHPENMVMFITGAIDIEQTIQFLEQSVIQLPESNVDIYHEPVDEPVIVHSREQHKAMDVLMPNCLIGYKLDMSHNNHVDHMKHELIYTILLDVLFGHSTSNYEELLHNGYINDSFGMDITLEDDYGFILLGGNTKYPTEFISVIQTMVEEASKNGLEVEQVNRTIKQIIGSFIQALNSLEYIANQFTKYYFQQTSLFHILDVASAITVEDIERALQTLTKDSVMSSYIIYPKQKDE